MAAAGAAAGAALVASPTHVIHAYDALVHHLSLGSQPLSDPPFDNVTCALFVTWNKCSRQGDSRLRGCIGTLEPRSLHAALQEYALTSALRDRRFAPITLAELPYLHCTVSLLHSFEQGVAWDDWEVGVHGIIINFGCPVTGGQRSATFLPEVAAHEQWDREATLEHLVRKAGCSAGATTRVRRSLKLTRYRSTTCTLSYEEYKKIKEPRLFRQPNPAANKAHVEEAITVPA